MPHIPGREEAMGLLRVGSPSERQANALFHPVVLWTEIGIPSLEHLRAWAIRHASGVPQARQCRLNERPASLTGRRGKRQVSVELDDSRSGFHKNLMRVECVVMVMAKSQTVFYLVNGSWCRRWINVGSYH